MNNTFLSRYLQKKIFEPKIFETFETFLSLFTGGFGSSYYCVIFSSISFAASCFM